MRAAALLAAVAAPAAAQQVDCAAPQLQIEMTYCAEQDWIAADAELNRVYGLARERMRRADAGLPAGLRGAEAMLRDAQRGWVRFRDDACAAEGWLLRGGTAEAMVIYACRARLTDARSADLRALAEAEY